MTLPLTDRLTKIVKAIAEKKQADDARKQAIVDKFNAKAKVKALTTAERLDRIEEYLGLK